MTIMPPRENKAVLLPARRSRCGVERTSRTVPAHLSHAILRGNDRYPHGRRHALRVAPVAGPYRRVGRGPTTGREPPATLRRTQNGTLNELGDIESLPMRRLDEPQSSLSSLRILPRQTGRLFCGGSMSKPTLEADGHYAEAEARVRNAQRLSARELSFNGLPFLKKLPKLNRLSHVELITLDETQVADLSPLAQLKHVRSLSFRSTPVADLTPLASLVRLRHLDITNSQVRSLSPLAHLTDLQCLIVDGCPVHDLQPLARLTELALAALAGNPIGGLSFRSCPISNPQLKEFSSSRNPHRTIDTLNVVRGQAGLPPIPADIADFPVLPPQGIGPHFSLRSDKVVDFSEPVDLDRIGNNVTQMRYFHREIRDILKSVSSKLDAGNKPYSLLRERIQKYTQFVDVEMTALLIPAAYAEGMRLNYALTATMREISDGNLPKLSVELDEALNSLLSLHLLLMSSSAEGRAINEESVYFDMSKSEREDLRAAAIALSDELTKSPLVIDPKAAEFILEGAKGIGEGHRPEVSASVGHSAIRNIAIALSAAGAVGAVAYGMAMGPLAIAGLLFVTGTLGSEGIKKSKVGQVAGEELRKMIDVTTVDFVLKNENLLRRIAGTKDQFQFIHRSLDWMKKMRADGKQ
jgi:Leucine-rich repeat (LRR) protein